MHLENRRDLYLQLNGSGYVGVANICYDDARACSPICFTALDEAGAALWGIGE